MLVVFARYDSRRERAKLKKALTRAEYLERQAAKNARNKALEEEEAKKIPYEVYFAVVVSCVLCFVGVGVDDACFGDAVGAY